MGNLNIISKRGNMNKLNKKGAEFTITTIIVIVLALIVLVVLVLGFGAGWSNLWNKIVNYFSPVNVDSVKQACSYACSTNQKFDYCCLLRDVRVSKDQTPQQLICDNPTIKPDDCSFSCAPEVCQSILCSGTLTEGTGTSAVIYTLAPAVSTACVATTGTTPADKKTYPDRTMNSDRSSLAAGMVCCGTKTANPTPAPAQ